MMRQQKRSKNRPTTSLGEDTMRRNFDIQSRWASFLAIAGVMGALGALYLPLI